MCVIVYKPKGIEVPSESILNNCFKINGDGVGFMFADSDSVIIRKGFMTFDGFMDSLKYYQSKYDLKNKNLIIHFRIATSGGTSPQKCHPFPLDGLSGNLNATKIKHNFGVVHNGVLSEYVYGNLSDTQNYIKDFLTPLFNLNNNVNNADVSKLISATLGTSKILILNKDDEVLRLGEWCEDGGVYYSNLTYKTSYYTSATKETAPTCWNYTKNYSLYDYDSTDKMSAYESLYYDIIDSFKYRLIPQDEDITICDSKDLTRQYTATYNTDFYIDSLGYLYELDYYYNEADFLGRARLFDKDGRELRFEDLSV